MSFIGIIPARYASSRFPGKPLADINGKPMIQRVYEQAAKALPLVYVATDDARIVECVENFNGNVVLTATTHRSGTDRCAEAIAKIQLDRKINFDVVINIQGDEPFIDPLQIHQLVSCFDTPEVQIATLIKRFSKEEDIFNPNAPKVVVSRGGEALYFSRSPIPYLRDAERSEWTAKHVFYKHVGLYAYRTDILKILSNLAPGALEVAESLEQLRWLENGYHIKVAETECETQAVDTPEDLARLLRKVL
ncbi:MAG: 3-deoxy-manno-octulosonate cytidylyltransferase [Bacteroidales bacterium]|nr:3-deoxy-manno-octulosonate cytidylyltransferase [Bacteroidales bacterium]MCL2133145.1 3-deoxy-manno-octulosonate cytidylyltransferase [Bacteroidales bacterium]